MMRPANAPRDNMGIDLIVGMRDGEWFDSDLGRDDLRIMRAGWFRVAVRLPEGESPADTKSIRLDCKHRGEPTTCDGVTVQKVFRLDRDYVPRRLSARAVPNAPPTTSAPPSP